MPVSGRCTTSPDVFSVINSRSTHHPGLAEVTEIEILGPLLDIVCRSFAFSIRG
jgi:hypothetical protein